VVGSGNSLQRKEGKFTLLFPYHGISRKMKDFEK
jgi:hypothetical protein